MDDLGNANNHSIGTPMYDSVQNESIPNPSSDEKALSEGIKNMFSYSTKPKVNTRTASVDQPQRKPNKNWKTDSSQSVSNEHNTLKPEDYQLIDDMVDNNLNAPSAPENTKVLLSIKESDPTNKIKSIKKDKNWSSTKDVFGDVNQTLLDDYKHFNDWRNIEIPTDVASPSIFKSRSEPGIIESPAQSAETRLCTASNQSA